MQSTTIPRHVIAVHGTHLGGELRKLLRALSYNPQAVKDVIDFIGVNGTCEGSAVELEDLEAVEALVVRHTAPIEYEGAEDWPAWTDSDVWETTDTEPANGLLPSEAFLAPDLEPSFADRRAWSEIQDREARIDRELDRLADEARALELLTAGLPPFPAIRSRVQTAWTDADQLRHHGCV